MANELGAGNAAGAKRSAGGVLAGDAADVLCIWLRHERSPTVGTVLH